MIINQLIKAIRQGVLLALNSLRRGFAQCTSTVSSLCIAKYAEMRCDRKQRVLNFCLGTNLGSGICRYSTLQERRAKHLSI